MHYAWMNRELRTADAKHEFEVSGPLREKSAAAKNLKDLKLLALARTAKTDEALAGLPVFAGVESRSVVHNSWSMLRRLLEFA